MLSKEEIEEAFEGMECFIDDDMGGYYRSVVGNQEANSMLGYLKIRDYILNLQNRVDQLESDKQKLIEKLEEDEYIIESTYSQINGNYFMAQDKLDYIREILSILKGENHE